MGSVKLGSLVADIRGRVGGVCFSRGGGGAIVRTAPKPINPKSARQNEQRAILAMLTQYWSSTLDEDERQQRRDYATGTNWTNKVGTTANISGLSAFVRTNALLFNMYGLIQENGPGLTGHAGEPTFEITANPVTDEIIVATPAAPWDDIIGNHRIAFFQHGPTSVGRIALSAMKRYAGYGRGVPGGPSQFPLTLTAPIAFNAGQNISVAGVFVDEYGRVGNAYVARVVAAVP